MRFDWWCIFACVIGLSGCGARPDGLPLMPVSGVVAINGKPTSGVMISFIPIGATRGRGAGGQTDANGRYELVNTQGKPGVAVGSYKVVANRFVLPDGTAFSPNSKTTLANSSARDVLPAKYSAFDRTTLTAMVHEGVNTIDFSLLAQP